MRQDYSLLVQEERQRQVTSEPTENFSIAEQQCRRRQHIQNSPMTNHGNTEDRCRKKKKKKKITMEMQYKSINKAIMDIDHR